MRVMQKSLVFYNQRFSGLIWDPLVRCSGACVSPRCTILERWDLRPGLSCTIISTPWKALENRPRILCVQALGSNDRDGRNGSNGVDGWDPSLDIEVPADQRPANELAALKEEALYSWAQLGWVDFGIRLGGLWLMFFIFLGAPIASASFEPSREPLRFVLAGGAGALFAVAVIVLRLYLGWSYVGNRLLSAVVPYEETGWYDGQLWVKPPEVLARDRLLGAYQVKPVMNRLKQTLIGAAALLVTATASLFLLVPQASESVASSASSSNSGALAAEAKFSLKKEDLLNLPADVLGDDELAAAAAAAANGRPVYCTDRYYRALAGGQYCRWDDLRK
ncbi:hypothetical protein KP509_06G029700 [Ceratopteris richardii]|uniref:Uncharacterized protein n=1 Tax=Ceratopteris richardii TaxID=49495 RepID=A0A8T2UEJ5_CERRI|nr:hypothetical protein KP509_06G029700 [Ceratopteris richardii]